MPSCPWDHNPRQAEQQKGVAPLLASTLSSYPPWKRRGVKEHKTHLFEVIFFKGPCQVAFFVHNKGMIIIAGLGNPGENYINTRHNVGFLAIDRIKEEYNFSDFSFLKNFNALVSKGIINGEKSILVKPQTFMNSSGTAIRKIIDYYKSSPSLLYVFHDDIDIPLGEIKIAKGRGPAGHNGVKSIIEEIKTKNFTRFRIGIKPEKKIIKAESFVLKKFNKKEAEIIDNAVSILLKELEKEICPLLS